MKKNDYLLILGVLSSLRTMACAGDTSPAQNENSETATGGGAGESAGSGGSSTAGDGDGDETGGAPSTAGPCDEYAEAAGWIEGSRAIGTATSTPERISAVGAETWNVALKMLGSIPSSAHPNIAHSSTSLYTALSMAYETYKESDCGPEIERVLEFPESGMDLHHSIGAGLRELSSRAIPASENSDGLNLNVTNSIWAIQSDGLPEPSEIESIYGATPNAVATSGEPVRALMNCLIEEDSEGLLKDFLPPGYPDVDTFTANVNVTYLAAPWAMPMQTGPVDFAVLGGALQEIDGLKAFGVTYRMYDADAFTTIELPLLGRELSALFVVPNDTFTGTLDEFGQSLTSEMLIEAQAAATSRYIDFEMPEVDIPSTTLDYLVPLGIDCDPIGGLRQIFHGAAVQMDEDGIKAAAATVVFGDGDSAPDPPQEFFHIDRPFLFFVHDPETGFALFSGRYQGPGL